MSKRVKINIECPHCKQNYSDDFYRTIWGEQEENRQMVMNDEINIATCPHCGHSFHLPLAMIYVDARRNFAVWWEPNHDPGIDSDAAGYAAMMGANSYYAKAPRIKDWEEFKETIQKYYRGELVGRPIEKMDFSALKKQSKNSGCMLVFLMLVALSCGLCLM